MRERAPFFLLGNAGRDGLTLVLRRVGVPNPFIRQGGVCRPVVKSEGRGAKARRKTPSVHVAISLLPSQADAVYWGKTLGFREEKRGMT